MDSMKAMGVGMVFGIIFAIVVMIMLIVFGADIISTIFGMGSDAQLVKTIKNMQTVVDDLYYLPSGSGDYFTLNIPRDTKLCFVNTTHPEPVYYADPKKTWDPDIVFQRIIKEEGYNIWYETSSGKSGGEIRRLSIAEGKSFCAVPGMEIYLQNVGGRVTIIED